MSHLISWATNRPRGLRYGSFLIRARALSDALTTTAIADDASARETVTTIAEMQKLVGDRGRYWEELLAGNDLAAQNFQALNNFYFKGHIPAEQVEGGLAAGLCKLLGWYEQNAPDRLAEVTEALRREADDQVTAMLDAFATRQLETVTIAIGQIFDTATTQDEIQDLFAESLDTGELSALLEEIGIADADSQTD